MKILTNLTTRKILELKPHPLNEKVYGENEDISSLVDSIRKSEIVEPFIIDENNTIISGHRRWRACQQLISEGLTQFETVQCEVRRYENEAEKVQSLIIANHTRTKTQWQIANEAKFRLEAEHQLADIRRRATQNNNSAKTAEVEKLPPLSQTGKARDIVAKEMGFSGKTIEKMVNVVTKAEELEKEGRIEDVDLIKNVLNNKSADAANNLAKNIDGLSDEVKTAIQVGEITVNKAIKVSKAVQVEPPIFADPTNIKKNIMPAVKSDVFQDNSVEKISEFESLLDGVGLTEDEVQKKSEDLMECINGGDFNEASKLIDKLITDAEKKLEKIQELDNANSNKDDYDENLNDWLTIQFAKQEHRLEYLDNYLEAFEMIFENEFELPDE